MATIWNHNTIQYKCIWEALQCCNNIIFTSTAIDHQHTINQEANSTGNAKHHKKLNYNSKQKTFHDYEQYSIEHSHTRETHSWTSCKNRWSRWRATDNMSIADKSAMITSAVSDHADIYVFFLSFLSLAWEQYCRFLSITYLHSQRRKVLLMVNALNCNKCTFRFPINWNNKSN